MVATSTRAFVRRMSAGDAFSITRELAEETPVAIEVNGVGYAVLMASPIDLPDLACGFLLTERVIDDVREIVDVECHRTELGVLMRVVVGTEAFERISLRIRHRTSDSSCGLCGVENLEQALRPLPRVSQVWTGSEDAVFVALRQLGGRQTLNAATGAVHAAARCDRAGTVVEVREDVGRHNAFDKLIGAMLQAGQGWDGGFALLTSRCSFELVEKAVLSDCPMLATISAPTELAVRRAADAGLALRVLARPDALLICE